MVLQRTSSIDFLRRNPANNSSSKPCGCRECVNRITAERDSHRHPLAAFVIAFAVASADLMKLPMHPGRALVVHLHSVNAHIARAGFWIARMYIWQGNETPSVFRPAFEDGQNEQRKTIATFDFMHHFLARRV